MIDRLVHTRRLNNWAFADSDRTVVMLLAMPECLRREGPHGGVYTFKLGKGAFVLSAYLAIFSTAKTPRVLSVHVQKTLRISA